MNGGHYQLLKSVNVGDSKLEGIKVNAYELGWRYTGDNLRTQIAAYYSLSDKSIAINKTDMTINVHADKRRIYGVEGAVDYFFEDSDWSAGTNFNVIRSETKVNGEWKKLVVDTASPSKVTAYVGWAPGDWNLRLQSQQTFDVSDDGDYTRPTPPGAARSMATTPRLPRQLYPAGGENQLQRGKPAGQRVHHRLGPTRADPVQPDLRLT